MSNLPSMRACSPTTVSSVMDVGFALSGVGVGTSLVVEAVFLSVNISILLSESAILAVVVVIRCVAAACNERDRIHLRSVHEDFEMHVRSRGETGRSHRA